MSVHRPRKRFGQHFLRDLGTIRRIVEAFAPRAGEPIVEIGPGDGALTRELLKQIASLHVIELDRDFAVQLRGAFSPERLIVHQADALKFDFCTLAPHRDVPVSRETGGRERPPPGGKLRLIGNLPYNISTPFLFHLLDRIHCIADMLFMLQKEVVARLAATPGTADYGRLSVMIQWRLKVEALFEVPSRAFYPPPKVDSAVVRLVPHEMLPAQPRDPAMFAQVVKAAFANRRKMLRNNLREIAGTERLHALGIDPQRRAETLTFEEFVRIADAVVADG